MVQLAELLDWRQHDHGDGPTCVARGLAELRLHGDLLVPEAVPLFAHDFGREDWHCAAADFDLRQWVGLEVVVPGGMRRCAAVEAEDDVASVCGREVAN